MKLGFVSAILDGWTFEEMIDTASEMGYACVEVACWPCGKAEYWVTSYEPENEAAKKLYESFGFAETGEMDDEENIAVLKL